MKILFVSAVLPYPLHSGGQIRIYNLLKRLGEKHEIHLYSFIRFEKEKQYLPKLRFCKNVTTVHRGRVWQPKYLIKTFTSSYPLLWSTYYNAEMLAFLSDEISMGNYDVVHSEPGYVWPSLPEMSIPTVVCEHNIEHMVYEAYVKQFPIGILRPFLMYDVKKMKLWQQHVWKQANHIITVSESDKTFIQQSNVSVVNNGVDIRAFPFRPKKSWGVKNLAFLYVGDFRWMENKDAAEHLIRDWWPAIQNKYPNATLRIAGKNAPAGPYFVGSVEKIQDELYAADIMLAPIRIGGGTKYKILEAMAAGLPVITTEQGIAGMDIAGSICVVTKPEDVVRLVAWLFDNTNRLNMVNRARKIIEKEYSWDLIAQKLDRIWNSLL